MKSNWKKTAGSILIMISLMSSSYAAMASELAEPNLAKPAAVPYSLTEAIRVDIKTVLNERVEGGTRVGIVVRMSNNRPTLVRVPEYELRLKTIEGIEYTLQSSASNPRSLQPKATTELSYMAVIDRTDNVMLSEANWTEIDEYMYPKTEKRIASIPINGLTWKGSDTPIQDPASVMKWGETFKIPSLLSPLEYTPLSMEKQVADSGTKLILQLLVTNPTDRRETLPDFMIEGKTGTEVFEGVKVINSTSDTSTPMASQVQSYSGNRVEKDKIILETREKTYVHFAIPTHNDTVLTSINLLTPEQFSQTGADGNPSVVNYLVGRLNILHPPASTKTAYPAYTFGAPMSFDPLSELIHHNLEVSVVELHMDDDKDEGSKHATSKFKIFNKSDIPMAVPVFQTELLSTDGYTYSGTRQTLTTQRILPNSGLVLDYSYTLPTSEDGKNLVLKINDTTTAAPYKMVIAGYQMDVQPMDTEEKFSVYPFDAIVTYWTISPIYNRTGNMSYSYKARFNLDLKRQEQIQIDNSFSKLQFELFDSADRLIGTTTSSFIGSGRLVSGENNIVFEATTEQLDRPLTIRLFEVFTTAEGDSKRLLGVYKQ
jgi:hypothetical protein